MKAACAVKWGTMTIADMSAEYLIEKSQGKGDAWLQAHGRSTLPSNSTVCKKGLNPQSWAGGKFPPFVKNMVKAGDTLCQQVYSGKFPKSTSGTVRP